MNKNGLYLLALNRLPEIGAKTIALLLAHFQDLSLISLSSVKELTTLGITEQRAEAIFRLDLLSTKADTLWLKQGSDRTIVTIESSKYPAILKEIYAPPPVLYLEGNIEALNDPAIGIVGTRKPSFTGRETALRFAYELAAQGIPIISGLALGIDTAAHLGALKAHGQTIAVLGTGINQTYPKSNHTLAEKIKKNGLLISEFPLGTKPEARHFPQRNRIISGLSLGILVVEAAIKSGSLITARYALEQNRDIFAIPGSIYQSQAQGCHYLLQQGAKLATSSDDLIIDLQLKPRFQAKKDSPLALGDKNLVKCIGFEITTIDQMIVRSGWKVETVCRELSNLELSGQVKAIPGGYLRCF